MRVLPSLVRPPRDAAGRRSGGSSRSLSLAGGATRQGALGALAPPIYDPMDRRNWRIAVGRTSSLPVRPRRGSSEQPTGPS